jgi:hypothetical protein
MGKYGDASIRATAYFIAARAESPEDAWKMAVREIFHDSAASQDKGCPRFLKNRLIDR